MAKKLGIVVAILSFLIAILLGVASMQPNVFRVSRSAEIHAPPAVVFKILNDLHQGERWSPYEKRDPKLKKTFAGPESGPGATFHWDGNDDVGAGSLEILESQPDEQIRLKLDFTRPMVCTNEVTYQLTPTTAGTNVSWTMEGQNNLMGKLIGLFINMDKMVGTDFETGLKTLDAVAQADAKAQSAESRPAEANPSPESPQAVPAQ